MPITDEVNTTEIYLAMREHLESIAEGVRSVLEVTPPELAGDIAETGILLTGGGALLDGMDKLIEKRTGVHVIVLMTRLSASRSVRATPRSIWIFLKITAESSRPARR